MSSLVSLLWNAPLHPPAAAAQMSKCGRCSGIRGIGCLNGERSPWDSVARDLKGLPVQWSQSLLVTAVFLACVPTASIFRHTPSAIGPTRAHTNTGQTTWREFWKVLVLFPRLLWKKTAFFFLSCKISHFPQLKENQFYFVMCLTCEVPLLPCTWQLLRANPRSLSSVLSSSQSFLRWLGAACLHL